MPMNIVCYQQGGASMVYDGVRHIIAQRETVTRSIDGQSVSVDVLLDFNGVRTSV